MAKSSDAKREQDVWQHMGGRAVSRGGCKVKPTQLERVANRAFVSRVRNVRDGCLKALMLTVCGREGRAPECEHTDGVGESGRQQMPMDATSPSADLSLWTAQRYGC